jgi:transposase-like protein
VGRRATNYPLELRERAVRMVAGVRPEYPSDWPAICAVAAKLGIGSAETLRKVGPPGRGGRGHPAGGDE